MSEDSRKLDEKLISIVKTKPVLYDLRIPTKERSKIIRTSVWREVSHLLGDQLEPDYAEARWKYLRENYIKSRRKEKMKDDIARRSGLKEPYRRGKYSFRYYELMEFLNDPLDYQKAITTNNVAKAKKLTEMKLEKNFKSESSRSLTMSESEYHEEQEQVDINLDKDMEFEEVDNEALVNSSNYVLQQNSNNGNNHVEQSKSNGFEQVFLQCLQKPIERPCPIDGFLVRLGEGLRRLPYRERSKLELEFLTRLHEVEELLCDDN